LKSAPARNELSFAKRLGYGVGGGIFAVKEAAYAVFVLLFYTQVVGLSGSYTGAALFIAVLFDCLSDPVIGAWSDSLRSRWGRRHPFMLGACLPMGIGFIGLFAPPEAIADSQLLLAAWLLFWSIWIRTLRSVFSIPHQAMSAEICSDYHGRSRILGVRLVFIGVATVLLPAAALTLLFDSSGDIDGRFVQSNYPAYGIISCVFTRAVGLICVWSTREYARPNLAEAGTPATPLNPMVFLRDFAGTLRNRNFRYLVGFELSANISYGILISLLMMVNIFYWELSSDQIAIILAGSALLGATLAMPAMSLLSQWLDKHSIIQLCCGLLLVDAVWVYVLRMLDWIPDNGHPLVFAALFVQMLLWMLLFILRGIASQSLTADITDEHELEHGRRQEGAFFAASAFSQKMASGLGPLYGGIVLDYVEITQGTVPGNVEQGTLNALAIATISGIITPLLFAWYFSSRVSLSEVRLMEIQADLAAR